MRLFICFSSYLNLSKSDHQVASDSQLPDNVAENDDVNSVQSGWTCVGGGGPKSDMQQLLTPTAANSSAAFPNLVRMYK